MSVDPTEESHAALLERLRNAAQGCQSEELALRAMRMHVDLVGPHSCKLTIDCTGATPQLSMGHSGPAHAATRVTESAFAAFFAAYSFEEVLPLFQDGSIRMIHGTCLQLMFFLRERPMEQTHVELRQAVQRALTADASDPR